jgi:hypothetical protein
MDQICAIDNRGLLAALSAQLGDELMRSVAEVLREVLDLIKQDTFALFGRMLI